MTEDAFHEKPGQVITCGENRQGHQTNGRERTPSSSEHHRTRLYNDLGVRKTNQLSMKPLKPAFAGGALSTEHRNSGTGGGRDGRGIGHVWSGWAWHRPPLPLVGTDVAPATSSRDGRGIGRPWSGWAWVGMGVAPATSGRDGRGTGHLWSGWAASGRDGRGTGHLRSGRAWHRPPLIGMGVAPAVVVGMLSPALALALALAPLCSALLLLL